MIPGMITVLQKHGSGSFLKRNRKRSDTPPYL